jgi:hypothetical protein
MKNNRVIATAVSLLLFCTVVFFGLRWWSHRNSPGRAEVLALMPADADAILYADLTALRQSPFVAQLIAWAPKPQADADYAQFVRDTGFDYERDLDHIAIASYKKSQRTTLFAVATGRFDKKKIAAYAQQHGKAFTTDKHAGSKLIFAVPMSDSPAVVFFTFLRDDEIAITDDDAGPGQLGDRVRPDDRRANWKTRFERLEGSPLFAVLQQNAGAGEALAAQAPGGLRSPQLSALLNRLQWITFAGLPAGESLRVVVEGESSDDATTRQLADMLNGVIILAQAGLNDPKTRQQLAPELRQAYLDLLSSADISRIDRNQTKSVRIVVDLNPKFLNVAKSASPAAPVAPVRTNRPAKGVTKK